MKRRPRPSPWLGHQRQLDGQTFEVLAAEIVDCPSGSSRWRLMWSTRCSACGAGFRSTTARKPQDGELRSLCGTHRPTRANVLRAIRYLLSDQADASRHDQEASLDH